MAASMVRHACLTSTRLFANLSSKTAPTCSVKATRNYARIYRRARRVLTEEEAEIVNKKLHLPGKTETSDDLWRKAAVVEGGSQLRDTQFKRKGRTILPDENQDIDFLTDHVEKIKEAVRGKTKESKSQISKIHLTSKNQPNLKSTSKHGTEYPTQPINITQNVLQRTHSQEKEDFMLPEGMRYEKLSQGDKRFGPVVMLAKSRKERMKTSTVVIEGSRLLNEALAADVTIDSLYFTQIELLNKLPLDKLWNANLYKVWVSQLKLWSDVKKPEGLLAVCRLPSRIGVSTKDIFPITLILDKVQDSGNMGTLLRTAAAVGCKQVLVTKGCVDIWGPKVLRAAAGAHFKMTIHSNLGWEVIHNYLDSDTQICLADHRSHVTVPNPGSRKAKEALKEVLSQESEVYDEQDEETGEFTCIDEAYLEPEKVSNYEHVPMTVSSIFDMRFTAKGTALVIAGETGGISNKAKKLCFDRHGGIVYIPMSQDIDCMTLESATVVCLYEIKRQLLQKMPAKDEEVDEELLDPEA